MATKQIVPVLRESFRVEALTEEDEAIVSRRLKYRLTNTSHLNITSHTSLRAKRSNPNFIGIKNPRRIIITNGVVFLIIMIQAAII